MAHVLVLPYPGQGHINPMLQFAKRLAEKGPRTTLVTTHFITKSIRACADPVHVTGISDGHDEGGFPSAKSLEDYLADLNTIGSHSLSILIEENRQFNRGFTCVVYDTYVPWAATVARRFGLPTVAFSTQSCAVSAIYYYVNEGMLDVPKVGSSVTFSGLPAMVRSEFPSFALQDGSYPTLAAFALHQFSLENDAWVLFNSFEELESEVVAGLTSHWRARTIGPCVPIAPAAAGDGRYTYGMNLLDPEDTCIKWLDRKPAASVAYVSFGSFASLGPDQMQELAQGLLASNKPFLWVVRATEEKDLPQHFLDAALLSDTALIVRWSPQLDVLAHDAVGCFVTHCGWNSTLEALIFGVPMVALGLWTDQPTNAKYIEAAWGIGVRACRDGETGLFMKGEVERCVRLVIEGAAGEEVRHNARHWKEVAQAAAGRGGSSDKNLDEFVEFVHAEASLHAEKPKGLELEGN